MMNVRHLSFFTKINTSNKPMITIIVNAFDSVSLF